MKGIVLLFFLLSLGTATADNIAVFSLDTNTTPLKANEQFSFLVSIQATNITNPTNFNLILYDNDAQFFFQSKTLDSNGSTIFPISYKTSIDGNHLFRVQIQNYADENQSDNIFDKTIMVYPLSDLAVSDVSTAYSQQPNSSTTVSVTLQNLTIQKSDSFDVAIYIDDIKTQTQRIPLIEGLGSTTKNFTITTATSGTHKITAVVDDANEIKEAYETNNSKSVFYGIIGGRDLVVQTSDITIPTTMTVDKTEQGTVILHNPSNYDFNNVLIRLYHGQEQVDSLIQSIVVNFPKNSSQTLSFAFTPRISGNDVVIVRIDPFNDQQEDSKENNRAELLLDVKARSDFDQNNFTSYTQFFQIKEDCFVLFSNNDKFSTQGIHDDGNSDFRLNFTLNDTFGTTLFSDTQGQTGKEYAKNGRTMRILSVSGNLASIVFVFSAATNVAYSTCTADAQKLASDLKQTEDNLVACNVNLTQAKADLDALQQARNANIVTVANAEQGQSECLNAKATCETNLSTAGSVCDNKMSVQHQELVSSCDRDKNSFNGQLLAKDKSIQDGNFLRLLGYALAFGIAVIFSILFICIKKGWL